MENGDNSTACYQESYAGTRSGRPTEAAPCFQMRGARFWTPFTFAENDRGAAMNRMSQPIASLSAQTGMGDWRPERNAMAPPMQRMAGL
jgi:hypothetical protein